MSLDFIYINITFTSIEKLFKGLRKFGNSFLGENAKESGSVVVRCLDTASADKWLAGYLCISVS